MTVARRPIRCALLAVPLLLAACSSQDDTIDTPIVRPTSVAPAGIYEGDWTSTTSGVSTTGQTTEQMTAAILNAPLVRCDTPAFVMFGISMAGYDVIYALALAALTLVGAKRSLAGRE